MEILSLKFFLFVIVCLILYYLLPEKLQNFFLLAASYYFYIAWSRRFAFILAAITLFNFFYAWFLDRRTRKKAFFLWLGIAINLGAFAVFLFEGFFGQNISNLLSVLSGMQFEIHILMPIGFSYYVLECITYLVEVYRKQIPASKNIADFSSALAFFIGIILSIVDFSLYLAYFPKLISGPIERPRAFLTQLAEKRVVDNPTIARSLMLILTGLVRGIVFAGMLILLFPPDVFGKPLNYSNLDLVASVVLYGFILYNQFAGYTNIVRGVSGLFGINLTRNFAAPIFSQSFSEFWTRWHISLSSWLRDYVYFPLSRYFLRRNPKRDNKANLLIPPMAAMLASGIWHGATLHLMVWGAINGVYAAGEQILMLFRKTDPSMKRPLWRQGLSMLTVAALSFGAAIPFGLDLNMSKVYLYGILIQDRWQFPDLRFLLVVAPALLLDWVQYRKDDEFTFLNWPGWVQGLLVALAFLAMFFVNQLQVALPPFSYP